MYWKFYIHTVECYVVLKKKEILIHAVTWRKLEDTGDEISQMR